METSHILILLLIGYIVFTIDQKQDNFPVPTVLVLIGIGLSFIPFFSSVEVTGNMIYHLFLPALLFTSAYQLPADGLKKNAGIISFLGVFGIMFTVAALGVSIYLLSGPFIPLSLLESLIIAAILTPTDPVSVVSIIKKSVGSEKIADVVEGESLINDGTSIVIFTTLAGMLADSRAFSIGTFLGEFLLVSIGGAGLGILFGWLMGKVVNVTHDRKYQVMLSIILAYGTFNITEYIGASGVLAAVFAGVMLSFKYESSEREEHFRESLDGFWEIAEASILSLLFLLIGIESAEFLIFDGWIFVIIIFILSMVIRYILVAGTTQAFPKWRHEINQKEAALIAWAGLKGTMSVFLILTLYSQNTGDLDMIISLSFAAVLISLVVQSLGVKPLSKKIVK
ncbi:sodium:proton antiporter [Salinicoccus sediminis]|uniref:Sodium:proton antiporter n=1 Tax=Salinicoccus sediminis TaxID=1432562 RepID=A0A0M2SPY1_9STAP|nr:sodium:proton antiporter [Salinicoccus sediminis]KKK34997.1 sodium:proton antiporter [Salinicoccus sediminis]